MREGIDNCDTEFINIVQEDLVLQKSFVVEDITNAIKNNSAIDVIRYNYNTNDYHEDYNNHTCDTSKFPERKEINVNNMTLSLSNQYSDNCHITTKDYYYHHIFPNVDKYDFMEHSIACEVGNKLPATIWHLGSYSDGFYIKHLDGRNN